MTERSVPVGAIATALAMVEMLNDRPVGVDLERHSDRLQTAVAEWGLDTITEANSTLIGLALTFIKPGPGEPDHIHGLIPAVVTRLRNLEFPEVPEVILPTIAGVLTAAHLSRSAYEWRISLGPIGNVEAMAWTYAAWALADFVDTVVLARPGAFADLVAAALGERG